MTAGIPDEGVEITDGIGTFVLRGSSGVGRSAGNGERPVPGRKVFIAHGKNRAPLDQLKKMLDQFKVPYAVAVDEPHRGPSHQRQGGRAHALDDPALPRWLESPCRPIRIVVIATGESRARSCAMALDNFMKGAPHESS